MNINGGGLSKMLHNNMRKTQTNLQKTMDKLASGQRIHSAANDAAGLSISQKMRALTIGSNQAVRNVQDAASLVQVADGAMQEMTEILHRIRELTVQSMNGTNTELGDSGTASSGADTLIIQNEIDELKKNLNEIVEHTEFNRIPLLTNKTVGEYIYEERSASKIIQLSPLNQTHAVDTRRNHVGHNEFDPIVQESDRNVSISRNKSSVTMEPEAYTGSTVLDYRPRWSEDGESIVFLSSRDGGEYVVPKNGSSVPMESNVSVSPQESQSFDNLMRLRSSGSTLYLERRSSDSSSLWYNVQSYNNYNANDGSEGYSFSPKVNEDGSTSFVYSDNEGNIKKVDVNLTNQTVTSGPVSIIPTSDVLNIPSDNQSMTLPSSPDLYRMNTNQASLRIQKFNDNGARELTYWDGQDTPPADGYYTVSNGTVTFYGNAIIGNEEVDDAQDYYSFSYVSDQLQNNFYTESIPAGAEVYNMHGEDGPRSLRIYVGATEVTKSQLLSERPSDVEGVTGVYVDGENGKIEFYGNLRPSYNQSVRIEYLSDSDSRNGIPTFSISSGIDTYNLIDTDLSANRSLRVYVGGQEVAYDETKTNGYVYEDNRISLYGDARPDVAGNPSVRIDYVNDASSTTKNVYGIPLNHSPEIYNLGSTTSPSSIRVFRNSTEELAYSNVKGYQYNSATNTIELYGESRPDVGDTYKIEMIVPTGDVARQDGKVEIPLTYSPETYGTTAPSTFKVLVDGVEVNYDQSKTNGYYFNSGTKRIELYGDARPKAGGSTFQPEVEVYYVYESPSTVLGNDSYDIRLSSTTLDYGVTDQTEPRAIRVYQNGGEVPWDAENGFTYDKDSRLISLHGTFRPDKDDPAGRYYVYSITSDDLKKTVPEGSYIYKVEMNGQEIQRADNSSGDGYVYDGSQIEIVGNARPDVTRTTSEISLNVQYFDSLEISLNDSMPNQYFHNYCEHETDNELTGAEIDPDTLYVSLNGNQLSSDQYSLQDNKIVLKEDTLTLNTGNHTLYVDYRVRKGVGYDDNDFTFQVGANSGQTYAVAISSFDNMLRDTNVLCVRTREDASKALGIVDKSLNFVLKELGNIGATENRLDHIASNLSIMEENTMASMSRIADADMAKESMNLMKEKLLSETQQAMSSQIKQSRERMVDLLR